MSDLTLAVSEAALKETVGALVEVFQFEVNPSTSGSPRFALHVKCHLERGDFALVPPDPHNPIFTGGFFKLTDLLIAWDNLDLTVTVHIPQVVTPSFCLVPNPIPFLPCIVEIPGMSFFDTDVSVTIGIDNLVKSRLGIGFAPLARRLWNNDKKTYQWLIVPQVVWQDIQPLDIADTIADLIDEIVKGLVDVALAPLPQWAKDAVNVIVGGFADLVRKLLSLPADLKDWLSNLLRVSLDPFDLILQILVNHFQNDLSLYTIDDPIQILPKDDSLGLPPVNLPLGAIDLSVQAVEFVIEVTS
jgi:hypothetical protein